MNLMTRKVIVVLFIVGVILTCNILVLAQWLNEKGVPEVANWIRSEFLTGTAIAVILAMLILLVNPSSRVVNSIRRSCPVCSHRLHGHPIYCSECGSKV